MAKRQALAIGYLAKIASIRFERLSARVTSRRPGGNIIGKPPLPKLSSQRTLRWSGIDSNVQFRAR
jgi:hypothetical protein